MPEATEVKNGKKAVLNLQAKKLFPILSSDVTDLFVSFLLLLSVKVLLVLIVIKNPASIISSFPAMVSTRWDSQYFVWIAGHGYPVGNFWQDAGSHYYAFMPVYPILIALDSYLTRDSLISAFLISNVFYFFTLVAFYFVARITVTSNRAVTATFLFGLFPLFATYGFFSYSDPVYLCFAITSWYFFANRNYAKSGLIAGLAACTRVLGVLLTPIYLTMIFYGHWKKKLKVEKTMLFLVVPVVCYLMISLYFFELSGNPFAILDAESKFWGVTLSGPVSLIRLLYRSGTFMFTSAVAVARLLYLSFFLIAACCVGKISRRLAFYSLSFMLLIINLSGTSVFSEPRYALAAWPIFLLFSNFRRRRTLVAIAIVEILLTVQSVIFHLTKFWT